MADEKVELLSLARSTGLNVDPTVLELLIELISLGVQPKDLCPYLRAIIARRQTASAPHQQLPSARAQPAAAVQ